MHRLNKYIYIYRPEKNTLIKLHQYSPLEQEPLNKKVTLIVPKKSIKLPLYGKKGGGGGRRKREGWG